MDEDLNDIMAGATEVKLFQEYGATAFCWSDRTISQIEATQTEEVLDKIWSVALQFVSAST